MSEYSVAQLGEMGAARISIGGALARLTQMTLLNTARAMLDDGDLSALGQAASGGEVNNFLN